MLKLRLDEYLVQRGYVNTRSQAENYIKLGKVNVDGDITTKPSFRVGEKNVVMFTSAKKYVSRGGFKLESVSDVLKLSFVNASVLDVGSSTGGFSDYALQHGAAKIIAVDVGKDQMNKQLKANPKIELHEQTDVRLLKSLSTKVDFVLIDVSFISIREVLKHLKKLIDENTLVVAMVKPQFESKDTASKHKGVIKNEAVRRNILNDFEAWVKASYKIINKSDSKVFGQKGNRERFYLLKLIISA